MEPPAGATATVKDPAARDHDPVKTKAPDPDPQPRTSSQKAGQSLQDWDTIATVGEWELSENLCVGTRLGSDPQVSVSHTLITGPPETGQPHVTELSGG